MTRGGPRGARAAGEVSDAKGGADGPIVKVLEILVSLAYVVYDVATTDPPGTGTTALIVVTCLAAEVVLIFQECHTATYGGLKVRTMSPEPSLSSHTRNPKSLTLGIHVYNRVYLHLNQR